MQHRHPLARRALTLASFVGVAVLSVSATVIADDPLHVRIDNLITSAADGVTASTASDAEFLRRVAIDLTGMPPSAQEIRDFVASTDPEKRTAAVDRLLANPRHARHMAEFLDVTLMERRPNTNIPQDEWMAYLIQSTRANKPWNQLAREILSADGTDDDPRAAVRFYLDRGSEANLLTRDVGRIFFGRDMQCAQCHDHALIDDYLQADYQGLLAFLAPGYELKIKEGDKERAYFAEKAGGDVPFESVFIKGVKHLTGARILGDIELAEPAFLPGDEYEVRPAENVLPLPKYSRRKKLAELATGGTNRAFNENIANRLWQMMMGRGLVHPVDLHHPGNPPTHPEVLRLLGEQFAAMNFDMRAMLRELALTKVYQRSLDAPPVSPAQTAAPDVVARLEAERTEVAARSSTSLSAFNAAIEAWNQSEVALLPLAVALDAANARYTEALKTVDAAQKAVADAQAQHAAKKAALDAVTAASTAAQAAVTQVPGDAELAAAAQKFAERAAQFTAELTALQVVVDEKLAAVAAPQAALDALRPEVEAARATLEPVRATERAQEQAANQTRQQMAADLTALNALDARLETWRRLAGLTNLETVQVAAREAIPARAAELAAANEQLAAQVAVVSQQQANVQAAQEAHTAAATSVAAIQAEHVQHTETAEAVEVASTSASTALARLPEDTAIQNSAAVLKTRAEELAAVVAEHQTQVDAMVAAEVTAAEAVRAAEAALQQLVAEQQQREAAIAAATTALQAAEGELASAEAAHRSALDELLTDWTVDFTVAELDPLSPEQLCWSIFKVTEVYDRHWAANAAEVAAASPLSEEAQNDPAQVASHQWEIEQRTYNKLIGNLPIFATVYGAGAGQPQTDFFATADQALFAANGGSLMSWAAPAGGNVAARIVAEPDSAKAAEDLYLTVLGRWPTAEETADVGTYLAARPEQRATAAQELVWGLMTSAEFRFNH